MSTLRATAYLICQAKRSRYGLADPETGLRVLDSLNIVASRKTRPSVLERDQVAVKITIEIPDVAFEPVTPTAVIEVPADLAQRGPIGVVVEDASEGGGPA